MKNKNLSWLRRLTSYGKLRSRLLLIYFLLIALPLGFFSLYSNFRVRNVVQNQTLSAAQNAFDDTFLAIDRIWTQLDEVIDILATDPLVYAVASNDPRDFTYIQRLQDSNQVATTFEQLRTLSGVDRIQLYVNNDYSYSNDQNNIVQINEISNGHWFYNATQTPNRFWCSPSDFSDQPTEDQKWFSSMQTIYNPRSIQEPLAIVRVDIDQSRLHSILDGTSITENGMLLIMREENILLASCSKNDADRIDSIAQQIKPTEIPAWDIIVENGTRYYVQSRALNSSGWHVASILPVKDIYHPGNMLSAEMLLIVAVVTVIAYLMAYFLSRSTLDRLSMLTKTMHEVENGNTEVRMEPAGDDEIAQLIGSFNQMMNQMDSLMDDKVEYGRQIKNLELKALQAQINPHFLYNSLDLINCTAISHNIPEISKMVNALSKFYRLSLSKGREIISVRDELKHIQLYLEIQNLRFDNRIHVTWDLDPSVDSCQVIKIILQPIVENAVIHGIFEKPSKSGCLSITTRRFEDGIRITISDDGVGMDEQTKRKNFTASEGIADTSGGYGVRNTNDRIKLAYGDSYGLTCSSVIGHGTTVIVHIPAIDPTSD